MKLFVSFSNELILYYAKEGARKQIPQISFFFHDEAKTHFFYSSMIKFAESRLAL